MTELLRDLMSTQWTDFTENGKCSNCGNCCSCILPLSDKDIQRIRKYIRKHNIKPITHNALLADPVLFDFTCPFCDTTKEKKCTIYEVRPEICKCFVCSKNKSDALKDSVQNPLLQDADIYIVREIFFGK